MLISFSFVFIYLEKENIYLTSKNVYINIGP